MTSNQAIFGHITWQVSRDHLFKKNVVEKQWKESLVEAYHKKVL